MDKNRKYLRIEGETLSFVCDDLHKIKPTDYPILDSDYNLFFKKQGDGSKFRVNPNPTGVGLFDLVIETPFVPDTSPVPPSNEDRLAALETALMGVL